jgi:hypothetical protein
VRSAVTILENFDAAYRGHRESNLRGYGLACFSLPVAIESTHLVSNTVGSRELILLV